MSEKNYKNLGPHESFFVREETPPKVCVEIEPKKDLGYVVHFVGQTHFRDLSEVDMVDIRGELEKIEKFKNIDVITLKNPE